jgi:hypothetical protein
MTTTTGPMSTRSAALMWTLRIVVAAGLAVDAVVHLRLAPEYQLAFPGGIGGRTLFRVEAVVAVIAAVAVLVRSSRGTYLVALLVAASAFVTVVLSRYVEVPALGPLPSMYEPLWFFEKSLSAIAEGIAALAAVTALLASTHTARSRNND